MLPPLWTNFLAFRSCCYPQPPPPPLPPPTPTPPQLPLPSVRQRWLMGRHYRNCNHYLFLTIVRLIFVFLYSHQRAKVGNWMRASRSFWLALYYWFFSHVFTHLEAIIFLKTNIQNLNFLLASHESWIAWLSAVNINTLVPRVKKWLITF